MTTTNKNENPNDRLIELNQLFAKRYTDEDPEYKQMANRPNSPPIVGDWQPERNTQRSDHQNQRRSYPYNQQHRSYSNDRRPYRDDPNDDRSYRNDSDNRRPYQNYSNDRRQYRDYSNHRQQNRDYSNPRQHNRDYSNHRQQNRDYSDRDRSPHRHRDSRH